MHVRSDLAVITCHYNWYNYNRPKYNLNRFLRQMEAMSIPVYGAEASLDGDFVTKDNNNWVHVKVKECNICWQKEALLNLAETIVPKQYTKIAWIDHDLFFTNLNWYNDTSKALDEFNLVQLFEDAYLTDIKGNVERHAYSFFSARGLNLQYIKHKKLSCWVDNDMNVVEVVKPLNYIPNPPVTKENKDQEKIINGIKCKPLYKMVYHVGFAYAANRSLWSKGIKLFPYFFLGSGDIAIALAVFNCSVKLYNDQFLQGHKEWVYAFYKYVNSKYSFIKGSVYHEYHGSRKNRNYDTRHTLVSKHNFVFENSLHLQDNLLVIKDAPEFSEDIKKYFKDRNEDI